MHRDIRGEAIASLASLDRTYMGDPQPAIVAAARLARDGRAAIYERNLSTGSSFIYPPIAALLYRPLVGLPQDEARDWLAAANHTLFIVVVTIMVQLACARRKLRAWPAAGCAAAAILFYPLVHAVQLNQATLLVTACIGGAWLALGDGGQALAGVVFAVALVVKPQLVLVLPALAWGARRMVAASLVTAAALLAVSLAYAGWDNHVDYLTRVLPSLARGYPYYANQGINGFLYRWVPEEGLGVFRQAPDVAFVRWGSRAAAAGALAGTLVVARRWHTRGVPVTWTFALAWLAATMVSPVAWQHHYAPALFAFVAVTCAQRDAPAGSALRRPLVAALTGLAFSLTAAYFEVRQLEGVAARLLASYVLYGAVALGAALVLAAESRATRR